MTLDRFGSRATLETPLGTRQIARGWTPSTVPRRLPYSINVLLESALRNLDGITVTMRTSSGSPATTRPTWASSEIPFIPGRVVLQDFTGVPAIVDLAAMRSAIVRMTGDAGRGAEGQSPDPADLVVDHSVQVDAFARSDALVINSGRNSRATRSATSS